jgi:V-type H+-transporting ATPase subunit a
MGFFSTYCGFIYNDFTSIPLKLFGDSCYEKNVAGLIVQKDDCVYPVGLDPAWFVAKNELNYVNSLKMKISVILGVLQMSLGVFMKALNSLYFGKYLDLFCEFIP